MIKKIITDNGCNDDRQEPKAIKAVWQ